MHFSRMRQRCFRLSVLLFFLTVMLCGGRICAQTISGKLIFADEFNRLWVINADGSGQTLLTSGGNLRDHNPAFSPDGSRISFDRMTLDGTNIYVMNADGTNAVAITTNTAAPPYLSSNSDPTWSADGTRIAFVSDRDGRRRKEIWVVNTDGTGLVKLTTNVQLGSDGQGPFYGWDTQPSWSPDGSRIVFSSNRDGLSSVELYIMNSDGSNQTRLTNNISDDLSPTWSPDSQRIAFYSNGGSRFGINIMNRDGSNVVNVTHEASMPAWSPDGTRLAIRQGDPTNGFKPQLYTMNIDGSNLLRITNNTFDSLEESWAPISSAPIPTSTISGHVVDGGGAPITGATLSLSGTLTRTTQSDVSGAYSFAGLPAGNYRIDITKSGFGFTPPSITFINVTADQTANFTAFVAFSIGGQINGLMFNGISVNLTGSQTRTVIADSNGHYAFDIVPAGGNYTVTPNSPYFNISPASAVFNNLSANQTANFDATRATYSISGTITRLGNPFPGVTLTLTNNGSAGSQKTTTTDANGNYSFPGETAGSLLLVSPSKPNYYFNPSNFGYVTLDGNKTANFVALSANNLLFTNSGFRIGEDRCSVQLTVARGGNALGVGPITVDYATSDGTAIAGSDYTPVNGTLSFPEGTYSRTITIPILDDQLLEGDETFSITLSNPMGEVDLATPSTATVTIADNDPAVPVLATEATSDRGIALNTVSWLPGPFTLTTPFNLSADQRTRISLFAQNVSPCQELSAITIDAEDGQQNHFQLPLEALVKLPGNNPFTQLVVRLPENLNAGDLLVTIRVGNLVSNKARI